MIDLKNKPTTLWIAVPILGAGILIGVGYLVYALVWSSLIFKDAGVGVIFGTPIVLAYVAQVLVLIAVAYLLLRNIYRWSKTAIIASTVCSPLALIIIVASIASRFGYIVDLSSTFGVGLFCFFLLTPLITGAVAYNDIRYRLPKIKPS